MTDPRYPIGQFDASQAITPEVREGWIEAIAQIPGEMQEAVRGLSDEQLEAPYREGGWTVRQVVHHVPDSHVHAYVRFKLALTEDNPTIKPYDEGPTALLADYKLPLEPSLLILENIHLRWVAIARGLSERDWGRTFVHPATGPWTLGQHLGLYVWHGRHHIAHVAELRKRMGW